MIKVPQPLVTKKYNKDMGGVARADLSNIDKIKEMLEAVIRLDLRYSCPEHLVTLRVTHMVIFYHQREG